MKISKIRIKNLRSIISEQYVDLKDGLTLIGPNNAGKSNALLAIYYFFTGQDNEHNYNHINDLPFHQDTVQTSITSTFLFEKNNNFDDEIIKKVNDINEMLENPQSKIIDSFSVNLVFRKNSPVYQIFPGVKQKEDQKNDYIVNQKKIIDLLLNYFKCYLIPSNKSIDKTYNDFIIPFIKKEISEAIKPYESIIKEKIIFLNQCMNESLSDSGINEITVSLGYPDEMLENLISSLSLRVNDTSTSSIHSKGMGVQSSVIFSALGWVTKKQIEKHIIWLIEEPETYMHPELAMKVCNMLDRLSTVATVVKTTHSINFLPRNINSIYGVSFDKSQGNTNLFKYKSISDATAGIRTALGIRFADYFNLSKINIFVEGETDVKYIKSAIASYEKYYDKKINLSDDNVNFMSFGGCTELSGFLKANFTFLFNEVVVISLFDGDEAGDKATKGLRGFFDKKCGFYPERDYTSIPDGKDIEGLFPDEWLWYVHKNNNDWIDRKNFDFDAANKIKKIKISDGFKNDFMNLMFEFMRNPHEENHPTGFDIVLEALSERVDKGLKRLGYH
ncbi:TPA: ATP-dependent endonuclease [Raoultella planticola]